MQLIDNLLVVRNIQMRRRNGGLYRRLRAIREFIKLLHLECCSLACLGSVLNLLLFSGDRWLLVGRLRLQLFDDGENTIFGIWLESDEDHFVRVSILVHALNLVLFGKLLNVKALLCDHSDELFVHLVDPRFK